MIFFLLMPHRKNGTLVCNGDIPIIVRCIDFSLACQPVSHLITAIEATVFGMKIGGVCNLIVMLCCLAIDGSFFLQCFCSVYGLRHGVPPLKISQVSRVVVHGVYKLAIYFHDELMTAIEPYGSTHSENFAVAPNAKVPRCVLHRTDGMNFFLKPEHIPDDVFSIFFCAGTGKSIVNICNKTKFSDFE
jgi:hypothetical protein